jgi:hypothetical protein
VWFPQRADRLRTVTYTVLSATLVNIGLVDAEHRRLARCVNWIRIA